MTISYDLNQVGFLVYKKYKENRSGLEKAPVEMAEKISDSNLPEAEVGILNH